MDDIRSTPSAWIILDPLIQLIVSISAKESADCDYKCKAHGSCTVTYTGALGQSQVKMCFWLNCDILFSPSRPQINRFSDFFLPSSQSNLQGSCFPASFGGYCSGTPSVCKDCNTVLTDCGGDRGMRPSFDWTSHKSDNKLKIPWHCKM